MRKIRTGDEVIVIAGKSKGLQGKVKGFVGDDRLVIDGVNLVKKHQKPNPQAGVQGGIIEKEAALHISNVAIFNAKSGKADKVSVKSLENGKRVRFYKSSDEQIDA